MKAKYIEFVSPDYLENLFSSDQFIRTNIRAGKRTERTGHETAYKIFKPIDKDAFRLSRIFEGNSFSTEGFEEALEKYHNAITSSDDIYPLVSAHFHPNFQLIPSPQDLLNVSGNKKAASMVYGYDLNPIFIIGRKREGIDLLVHQQKAPYLPEGLFGQTMDDLYDYNFCNEYNEKSTDYPYQVAEKIRDSGLYNATVIRIEADGKINLNLKEIEAFSFEARRCPEECFSAFGLSTLNENVPSYG